VGKTTTSTSFRFGNKEYGFRSRVPLGDAERPGRRLREFLRYEGDVFGYVYDFGDNWEHDVVVERIVTGTEVTGGCVPGGGESAAGGCRKVLRYMSIWKP